MLVIDRNHIPENPNLEEGAVLLIDKPYGITSFLAVKKVKRLFKNKVKKVGHAGTLDPLASGLLIICVGKYTKKITLFQDMMKTYTGEMKLGATTPSYDLETEVDQRFPEVDFNLEELQSKTAEFTGHQKQRPPDFSAVRVDGKRAYELARKGVKADIKEKDIFIEKFIIDNYHDEVASFEVNCSKGTYIRSLVHDYGKRLENGAYLQNLRRTRIGEYKVEDAFEPEELYKHYEHLLSSNEGL